MKSLTEASTRQRGIASDDAAPIADWRSLLLGSLFTGAHPLRPRPDGNIQEVVGGLPRPWESSLRAIFFFKSRAPSLDPDVRSTN